MPMQIYYANNNISENARRLLHMNEIKETKQKHDTDILYLHFENVNFKQFPNLRYILCPATNVNHLKDIVVYSPDGIHYPEVINVDSGRFLFNNVHSTAESILWGIMNLLKPGLTTESQLYSSYELKDKTVGIIGAGRVGQQLAIKLVGLGARPLLYDVHFTLYDEDLSIFIKYDLDKILYTSDIISVNAIADETTENLIGKKEFDKMVLKPWFINTSRGSVVNGKTLLQAARLRQIKGFYIDVMDSYDLDTKFDLMNLTTLPNFIITQHKAGSSIESRNETDLYVVNKLLRRLEGK